MVSSIGVDLFGGVVTGLLGFLLVLWSLRDKGGLDVWQHFRGRPNRIALLVWGICVMVSGIALALGHPWPRSTWLFAGLPAGGSIALAVFGLVAPRFTAKTWTHLVDKQAASRLRIPVPSFEESVRNARVDGVLLLAAWASLLGYFRLASTEIVSSYLRADAVLLAVSVVLFAVAFARRGIDYTIKAPRRAERTK